MNDKLIEIIREIIADNVAYNYIDGVVEIEGGISAEIAALLEAERKPDTITIPEAVASLVEYFETWDIIFSSLDLYTCITIRNSWRGGEKPDWVNAIINGNETPAAVKVGLEDLFVSILMDAKEAAS